MEIRVAIRMASPKSWETKRIVLFSFFEDEGLRWIIVSDLEKEHAIWFGGKDRHKDHMDEFYASIEQKRSKTISLQS